MTVLLRAAALAALLAAALPAAAQSSGFPGPAAALPSGGPVKGARYVIDPTHTFVNYEIGHYGTTTNRGRFSTKDGSVTIDASGGGKVEITMDMSSVNTGVDLLNRHIQSKDFLNIADFPTSRFVADKLRFDGSNKVSEVEGTLTLLGRTLPVILRANKFNCYLSPMINRQVCGGDFETTVERSRWGVTWGLNFGFEDRVRLLVQVEAINVPQ